MATEFESMKSAIKQKSHKMFRRMYMKRKGTSGYEASWQEIESKLIIDWGSVSYAEDSIKPNFFNQSGLDFTVQNDTGFFNEVDDSNSFFFDQLSIYGTQVRIDCGYEYNDEELPTNSTIFVGLMDNEYSISDNNEIQFSSSNLLSIFERESASRISGLSGTLTATDIFELIRDHTDGSGNVIFRQYISQSSWSIATTVNNYVISTDTTLQNNTVFDLMNSIAEAEGYVFYVTRDGGFEFKDRVANAGDIWAFNGVGSIDKTFGHNLISLDARTTPYNKIFNRIRIKHEPEDTTTSYQTKEEAWTWGDGTSSYKYGVRTLSFENFYLNSVTADLISNNLFSEYSEVKQEFDIKTKYSPHILVNDAVTLTYRTSSNEVGATIWGAFLWGAANWSANKVNINISNLNCRVLSISHNLDTFVSTLKLRATG